MILVDWTGSDWVDQKKLKVKSEPIGHGEQGTDSKKNWNKPFSLSDIYQKKTVQICGVKFTAREQDHSDIYQKNFPKMGCEIGDQWM